jgi:hypothetical protein
MTTPTLFKEYTWLVNTIEIRRDGSSDHFWVWHIIKDGRCMMEEGRWKMEDVIIMRRIKPL